MFPTRSKTSPPTQAQISINAVNTEDMMKYMPSIVVRKRHYGDTQDPLATRTSGVGASARSLLYVDGILISSPIGNNNTCASPAFRHRRSRRTSEFRGDLWPLRRRICRRLHRRGAQHHHPNAGSFRTLCRCAGGGGKISTNMPRDQTYGTWQLSGGIGDRDGDFSWRLSANHLDTIAQPLAYVTLTRPATASAAGTAGHRRLQRLQPHRHADRR